MYSSPYWYIFLLQFTQCVLPRTFQKAAISTHRLATCLLFALGRGEAAKGIGDTAPEACVSTASPAVTRGRTQQTGQILAVPRTEFPRTQLLAYIFQRFCEHVTNTWNFWPCLYFLFSNRISHWQSGWFQLEKLRAINCFRNRFLIRVLCRAFNLAAIKDRFISVASSYQLSPLIILYPHNLIAPHHDYTISVL